MKNNKLLTGLAIFSLMLVCFAIAGSYTINTDTRTDEYLARMATAQNVTPQEQLNTIISNGLKQQIQAERRALEDTLAKKIDKCRKDDITLQKCIKALKKELKE